MFATLTEHLTQALKTIRGEVRLTEDNIQVTLREIRLALLEADVALPVVKILIAQIKAKALGTEVAKSLNPGQAFIKIVHTELTHIMGIGECPLNLKAVPPAVILMAGLQGSGKTTSTAKLAKFLQDRHKKSVLLVSCDVYRPAAIQQLEVLANSVGVRFFASNATQKPVAIVTAAIDYAKHQSLEVVIIDTAGRLAIDAAMMLEIQALHSATKPIETLFVVDSMMGQDAANVAKIFSESLPLTGIILTKTDGDARGGAALSVSYLTAKPIKFIGVGEKTDALEAFHPERMASRILAMGDVLSVIEQARQKINLDETQQLSKKLQQGGNFTVQDFATQLRQFDKLGGMQVLLSKLPGIKQSALPATPPQPDGNKILLAAIDSMTRQERRYPELIKASRKIRIAKGAGVQVQDVNRLLKQFDQMQKMMKKVSGKGGMKKAMRGMMGLLPPHMRQN